MIETKDFINNLIDQNFTFFSGVPDSLLSPLITEIEQYNKIKLTITPNEGHSVALGIGYYLKTKKIPVVFLQNSGLGNIINPLTSLANEKIFDIPILFLIGWRGEPGVNDEPQHVFQGEITIKQLDLLNIEYFVVNSETHNEEILEFLDKTLNKSKRIALIFTKSSLPNSKFKYEEYLNFPKRFDYLDMLTDFLPKDAIVLSTTGKLSRELYTLRKQKEQINNDFYTIGGMGYASTIALGICEEENSKLVICLDGDGSILMQLGSLALIGRKNPKNLVHILFNNFSHQSVGGQPTHSEMVDFSQVVKGFGYLNYKKISNLEDFKSELNNIEQYKQLTFIELNTQNNSIENLMRPDLPPKELKNNFMDHIEK